MIRGRRVLNRWLLNWGHVTTIDDDTGEWTMQWRMWIARRGRSTLYLFRGPTRPDPDGDE